MARSLSGITAKRWLLLLDDDASARVGVVVLSNVAFPVDDIGWLLVKPPLEHTEVKVDSRLYDSYVGNYQLQPDFVLTVSREDDRLFTQMTGQRKIEIFPESDRDYFLKAFDAQITFVTGDKGRATELIMHQNGFHFHAKRVE